MKRRKFVNPRGTAPPPERWLYGVHAIAEWVRTRPARLHVVRYDTQATGRAAEVVHLAQAAHLRVEPADARTLTALAGTTRHQGLAALAAPFPYAEVEQVVAGRPRLLVVADQLQDPHNLGALLRTAEAVGAAGIILPRDGTVPVTPTVEAAAAGAAALLPVCRVTNLARTLGMLKANGYWMTALVPRGGRELFEFEAPERSVVVLGGETGLRPLVAKQCDFLVSIPMFGRVESLNASVAAAVVLYELRRRWEVA